MANDIKLVVSYYLQYPDIEDFITKVDDDLENNIISYDIFDISLQELETLVNNSNITWQEALTFTYALYTKSNVF